MPEGSTTRRARDLALWSALVAVLLLVPRDGPGLGWLDLPVMPWLDKVVHFLLFLVLSFLANRAVDGHIEHAVLVAVASSIAYGALLEVAQGALGSRSAELRDVLADGLGSACAVTLMRIQRKS